MKLITNQIAPILLGTTIFSTNTLARPFERNSEETNILNHTAHTIITRPLSSLIAVDYDVKCSNPQNLPFCSPDCTMRESTVKSFTDFYFNRVMWSDANVRAIKELAALATRTCAPNDVNGNQVPGRPCYNMYKGDPPLCIGQSQPELPDKPASQSDIDSIQSTEDTDEYATYSNPQHYPPVPPECVWQEISEYGVGNFTEAKVPQTDQNYQAMNMLYEMGADTCIPRDTDGNQIEGQHYHVTLPNDPPPCP